MSANGHRSTAGRQRNFLGSSIDAQARPVQAVDDEALVPITVWRIDGRDGPAAEPGSGFASRLARRLVQTYTAPGEAIIDFDANQHLCHAAETMSRSYLAITDPSAIADLDTLDEPVSLMILRWPRPDTPSSTSVADMFTGCRLIMDADTAVIAAVSSAEPGEPGRTFAHHRGELLPAARSARLRHDLQIVAVGGTGRDEFLYYATRAEADAARHQGLSTAYGGACHFDLLVFSATANRHD